MWIWKVVKHHFEDFLKWLGIYEVIHGPYYFLQSMFVRFFHQKTSILVSGITTVFWTPTPVFYRRITSLSGERKILDYVLENIKSGDTFWDVGANIGTYALLASVAVGTTGFVYAFEPENESFVMLNRNGRLNNIHNMETLPIALGNYNGKATIHPSQRQGIGIHKLFYGENLQKNGTVVQLNTGDSLVKSQIAMQPNIVKIDVEGFELDVLEGMKSTLSQEVCRLLIVEVHPKELQLLEKSADDVYSLIKQLGFSIDLESERASQLHWLCHK